MKERTFKLDDLGIIPYDDETEEHFIKRGDKYLYLPKSKDFLEEIVTKPGSELIALPEGEICVLYGEIEKATLKGSAKKIAKYFNYDLSWVNGFYAVLPIGKDGIAWHNKKTSAEKIKIPPFILVDHRLTYFTDRTLPFERFFNGRHAGAAIPRIKDVILHELIHCARHFTEKKTNDDFEETFCSLLNGKPKFNAPFPWYAKEEEGKIVICYKKLQDIVTEKAGYVLGRLKEDDIDKINKIRKPKGYIERAKSLRFKIIKEKLAL